MFSEVTATPTRKIAQAGRFRSALGILDIVVAFYVYQSIGGYALFCQFKNRESRDQVQCANGMSVHFYLSHSLSDLHTTTVPHLGLHAAAASGDYGHVKYALEHGQPVNSVLDGVLPLHAASAGGNEMVVKLLIESGADVNAARYACVSSYDQLRKYIKSRAVCLASTLHPHHHLIL